MRIELLYFDGCPSWQTALQNLQAALAEAGIDTPIELVRVESDDEALRQRFQGSPTIRVDGLDLFPAGHDSYALGCRVYQTPDGLRGWPTVEMIRAALAGG